MLKIQKLLSIILIVVLTIGCHQLNGIPTSQNTNQLPNLIPINLGNQFELKVNQEALIDPEKIKIKFLNVEEDSRCPSDVQCVWPGQVKILVKVINQEQDLGEFNLISRVGEKAVKTFDGYSIELIEVTPYPQKNQRPEISDYQVTLVVSQKR